MADQIIKEGDTVVFDVNGERQSFIIARPKTKVKVGKSFYSAEPLIGCPYGSLFTLSADGKSLERTKHFPSKEWDAPVEVTRDNSKLVDANDTNQALKQDDIMAMKESGKGGMEIIEALTNNSATFETKSEFAQEKYKRRKAKKYVLIACARRPTAASICAAHYGKQPSRIGYLRPDALGILLHMANVGAGGHILVLESCGGMITGAVAERLGGHGAVCAAYIGSRSPSIDVVRSFNFTPEVRATVKQAPLVALLQTRQQQLVQEETAAEKAKAASIPKVGDQATCDTDAAEAKDPVLIEEAEPMDTAGEAGPTSAPSAAAAQEEAVQGTTENNNKEEKKPSTPSSTRSSYGGPPFSGCIIAGGPLHPTTALQALFPLMAPSSSFAVASLHLQPLAEAMFALRTSGAAVNMAVQETWYREQQVLPGRTHPTMAMNHGGGYFLSGTVTLIGTKLPLVLPSADGGELRW